MVALRHGPEGAVLASLGLAAAIFVLTSTSIGCQDLGALIARQPEVGARWQDHLLALPFGTIHAATFVLPRPLGTVMSDPDGFRPASLDGEPEMVGTISGSDPAVEAPLSFPSVDRSGKGDVLGARPRPVPDQPGEPRTEPLPAEFETASTGDAVRPPEQPLLANEGIQTEAADSAGAAASEGRPDLSILEAAADPDPTHHLAKLYFDAEPADAPIAGIEPWAQGEEPAPMTLHQPVDSDLKWFVLSGSPADIDRKSAEVGMSVAGKGEVTGEGHRPKSPAERLGLDAKARAKAEKCLANAIYFEARGEQVRGQIAVAQVVMNRVFSGYYPSDVCAVVYQNASRHLACQFTFACDGRSKLVREPDAYARARRIALDTLDGRLWLSDVGKATHYHAYWVHPRWVREMHKLDRIGVHTFYRPRVWGNGADAPSWGSAQETAAITPTL